MTSTVFDNIKINKWIDKYSNSRKTIGHLNKTRFNKLHILNNDNKKKTIDSKNKTKRVKHKRRRPTSSNKKMIT